MVTCQEKAVASSHSFERKIRGRHSVPFELQCAEKEHCSFNYP